MVGILLLATSTRLHELDTRSLWADEGWSLVLAEGPTLSDVTQRMAFDQHPPLYFMMLRLWEDATGSSEFTLRYLSVLTSLLGVAGIYQLGKIAFRPAVGFIAAFLLAVWDHHIDLSQDTRHYAQLATLIILSTWFYMRLIRPEQSRRELRASSVGYVLVSSALLYSHYLGGFVLICHAIHMLMFVRPVSHLRWTLFTFGAMCASFLPWFPVVIQQNQVRWETPLYYLNSLPNSTDTYLMVRDALLGQQYALFGFLIAWGLWFTFHQQLHQHIRPLTLLLLWVVGYLTMTYILNAQPDRQFLTIRNFIVVTPALMLLMALGLDALPPRLQGLMLTVVLVLSLTTIDTQQLKPPWREVFLNVSDHHTGDEPVLMDIWVGDFPGRYYVEQQISPDTPWLSLREARDEYNVNFLPIVLTYLDNYDAFWLVYWRSLPVDDNDYAGIIEQLGFQRTATFYEDHVGNQLYSYRYDRRPDETLASYRMSDDASIELHRASIDGATVQLLLSATMQPSVDYSLSVILLNEDNQPVWNQDQPPITSTTQWQPGELFFDEHQLRLPVDLPSGRYKVAVKIYYYLEPTQPLATCAEDVIDCEWIIIGELVAN